MSEEEVTERLENFDATFAGRAIAGFVDDLSNWYVRRSRRRFWDGDGAAFATLRECLLTVAQLSAPFTPWLDPMHYTLLPGGSFEGGAAGWTLSGGARVMSGNETYKVNGAGDSTWRA